MPNAAMYLQPNSLFRKPGPEQSQFREPINLNEQLKLPLKNISDPWTPGYDFGGFDTKLIISPITHLEPDIGLEGSGFAVI